MGRQRRAASLEGPGAKAHADTARWGTGWAVFGIRMTKRGNRSAGDSSRRQIPPMTPYPRSKATGPLITASLAPADPFLACISLQCVWPTTTTPSLSSFLQEQPALPPWRGCVDNALWGKPVLRVGFGASFGSLIERVAAVPLRWSPLA
jgi:hypothetical protein